MRRRRRRQRTKSRPRIATRQPRLVDPEPRPRRSSLRPPAPAPANVVVRSLASVGAFALATVLSGVVDAAPAKKVPTILPPPPPAHVAPAPPPPAPKRHFVPKPHEPSWGAALPSVAVTNNNTGAKGTFRLYTDHGSLDLEEMKSFMTVVNGEDEPLDTRLVQLVFRAAYHFNGAAMTIVSGTRKGAHGKHATGEALDFKLEGVSAAALASYARSYPRAGVGIYTHPKTQFVHVDVRAHSYHWIDGSPPGVTWREKLLPDPKQEERDASYNALADLPETAR